MPLEHIEQKLRDGAKLHAFRSGGGLRVVRVEMEGELVGYGEHPQVEDALSHCDEDCLHGGRDYREVYGRAKPNYLTGSSSPTSELDAWLLRGQTFDAARTLGGFEVVLSGYAHMETPAHVSEAVFKHKQTVEWEERGFRYRATPSAFPGNREPCMLINTISRPEGRHHLDDTMWNIEKRGSGSTLTEAFAAAIMAPEVEVERQHP